jgi:phosphoribosyl 1,2-cyclic phosphodiesterase
MKGASATDNLTIRFRGVRGSLPSPSPANLRYGGNTACLEVRYREELLILDAGSGLRALGEELLGAFGPAAIEANLLVSHTHWDHIQGLPFFTPGYLPQNNISIYAAFAGAERLHRALSNQMSPLHFPVGLLQMQGLRPPRELLPGASTLGSFVVRTMQLNHPGGCTGFRIEAGGRAFAYLPDHEPYGRKPDGVSGRSYDALIRFVSGVDLLVLDTQYTEEEYALRVGWGHGCLPDSVKLAVEAGVPRLFLFHHDPSHDDSRIDTMVEKARELAAGSNTVVEAAAENVEIHLRQEESSSGIKPAALCQVSFPAEASN